MSLAQTHDTGAARRSAKAKYDTRPSKTSTGVFMKEQHHSEDGGSFWNTRVLFQRRKGRIDWRKMGRVEVEKVMREGDLQALQENLENLTFAEIDPDEDAHNLVKLLKLAQLMIEYLLYSQDWMEQTNAQLTSSNQILQAENEDLSQKIKEETMNMASIKGELKEKRRLIATYESLLELSGGKSHRIESLPCDQCHKAFLSEEFLQRHKLKRHTKVQEVPPPVAPLVNNFSEQAAELERATKALLSRQDSLTELEKRMRDMMEKKLEEGLAEGMARQKRREEDLESELQKQRQSNSALQQEWERKQREMQETIARQREELERQLRESVLNVAPRSNLGEMIDDRDDDERVAKLQEEINRAKNDLARYQEHALEKERNNSETIQDLQQELNKLKRLATAGSGVDPRRLEEMEREDMNRAKRLEEQLESKIRRLEEMLTEADERTAKEARKNVHDVELGLRDALAKEADLNAKTERQVAELRRLLEETKKKSLEPRSPKPEPRVVVVEPKPVVVQPKPTNVVVVEPKKKKEKKVVEEAPPPPPLDTTVDSEMPIENLSMSMDVLALKKQYAPLKKYPCLLARYDHHADDAEAKIAEAEELLQDELGAVGLADDAAIKALTEAQLTAKLKEVEKRCEAKSETRSAIEQEIEHLMRQHYTPDPQLLKLRKELQAESEAEKKKQEKSASKKSGGEREHSVTSPVKSSESPTKKKIVKPNAQPSRTGSFSRSRDSAGTGVFTDEDSEFDHDFDEDDVHNRSTGPAKGSGDKLSASYPGPRSSADVRGFDDSLNSEEHLSRGAGSGGSKRGEGLSKSVGSLSKKPKHAAGAQYDDEDEDFDDDFDDTFQSRTRSSYDDYDHTRESLRSSSGRGKTNQTNVSGGIGSARSSGGGGGREGTRGFNERSYDDFDDEDDDYYDDDDDDAQHRSSSQSKGRSHSGGGGGARGGAVYSDEEEDADHRQGKGSKGSSSGGGGGGGGGRWDSPPKVVRATTGGNRPQNNRYLQDLDDEDVMDDIVSPSPKGKKAAREPSTHDQALKAAVEKQRLKNRSSGAGAFADDDDDDSDIAIRKPTKKSSVDDVDAFMREEEAAKPKKPTVHYDDIDDLEEELI